MARGRKPANTITSTTWEDIFWKNLPQYINILNNYLNSIGFELIEVSNVLDKLSFKIPKGLISKEIKFEGKHPVISQSKEFIIGYSNRTELLIDSDFPLIVYGDHSKTIKYVEKPFIIGADGVKILKPIKSFNEKFFYYFLHGVITDTKDYGRHFSLLRKGLMPKITDIELQMAIVNFLDDLNKNLIKENRIYFNNEIESKIYNLQTNQLKQIDILNELTHQLDLIKQLRQAFLREAIQGKLIPNDELRITNEETGQQLLAKIKAEKAHLIKEKKLKKEKELSSISEEEIPFEIPEHWVWCRLGDILEHTFYGPRFSNSDYVKEGIPTIRTTDMSVKGIIALKNAPMIKLNIQSKIDLYKIEYNDLLITRTGSIGTMALFKSDYLAIPSAYLIRCRFLVNQMADYLFRVLKTDYSLNYFGLNTKTGTRPNINAVSISNLIIPIPPLHEQEQIVAKLEKLMTFCEDLEQSIKESQGYNEMLLQQVLREALQPKVETKVITLESRKIEQPLKTILAGHIINLNNTTDFGRVKFQKLLYLTEYCCKIDFDSHYVKKAAGPYDDELIKKIEVDFARLRFYNVVQDKTETKRVRYTALSGAKEIENLFLENYPDESSKINNLLMKLRPLSWGECEVVATIYAVWNNRIIKNEPVTDDLLYNDFMAWDAQKIKYKDIFYKKLFWMKEENIIADGWGKYVDKPSIKMS